MTSVKIVVAGGFGVGKTTFVGSVSEITPLTTEAVMTVASTDVDDLSHVPDKSTTTVAMDFGRITLDKDLVLYMFGTPGQHRFWFMWDDLIQGAIGAVVLVDTRRLADSFPAVDYFEASGLPFVIGINGFHGQFPHRSRDVSEALAISPDVPVIPCDARNRESTKATLVTLVEHAMSMQTAGRFLPVGVPLRSKGMQHRSQHASRTPSITSSSSAASSTAAGNRSGRRALKMRPRAREAAGEQAVRDVLLRSLAPFEDPQTRVVTLEDTFRWVAARR